MKVHKMKRMHIILGMFMTSLSVLCFSLQLSGTGIYVVYVIMYWFVYLFVKPPDLSGCVKEESSDTPSDHGKIY